MTELLLLPLRVFPGWPQPEPTSMLHLVLLCVVGPLALAGVIAAIANAPRLLRQGREEAAAAGLGAPELPASDETAAVESPRRAEISS